MTDSAASAKRYKGILTGAASGLLARGLTLSIGLLAVNLTLPYLGPERFGAWATIVTLQLWLQLADAGLPAGLTTPIARDLTSLRFESVRRLMFTTLIIISLTALVLFLTSVFLVQGLGITRAIKFGTDATRREFNLALLVGIGLTLLGTANTITSKVLAIQHKAFIANAWLSLGQVGSIAGLVISSSLKLDVVWLTLLTTGSVSAGNIACTVWFYSKNIALRPTRHDFKLRALRPIWSVSLAYTSLQLAGMLLLNSAVLIVSAVLSPVTAAVFVATSRLTGLCTALALLVSPYFWASYTDALVRQDFQWLRDAFRRHLAASVISTLALSLFLAALGPSILSLWTKATLSPDLGLLYWLLVWQIIIAAMNPVGALLNAFELYRVQTFTSLLAGVVGSCLGYLLANRFGASGVAASITLAYLIFVAVPVSIQARYILRPKCASV